MNANALFASPAAGVAVMAFLLAFLFVPFRDFKRFTPFGLVGGVAVAFAIFLLGGPLLDLWRFRGPFVVAGIPVMLVITWYPVEILFAYGLDLLDLPRRRAGLVLLVSFVAMLVYVYLRAHEVWQGRVPFGESGIFVLALALHGFFAFYLGRHRRREPRSSIPPLV